MSMAIREREPSAKRNEIYGVLLFSFGFLVLLALISGNLADTYPPAGRSGNWIGVAGDWISRVIIYTFGRWVGFLIPLSFFLFGYGKFKGGALEKLPARLIGLVLLVISMCTLQAMIYFEPIKEAAIPQGDIYRSIVDNAGLLGGFIVHQLHFGEMFGKVGATVIASVLILISILLLSEVLLYNLFDMWRKQSQERKKAMAERREQRLAAAPAPVKKISGRRKSPIIIDPVEAVSEEEEPSDIRSDDEPTYDEEETFEPPLKPVIKEIPKVVEAKAPLPDDRVAIQKTFDFGSQYILPGLDLLLEPKKTGPKEMTEEELMATSESLEQTLRHFGVDATVTQITRGPVITRFELKPAPGVKISRISNLSDDIALSLAATNLRIVAPIPGKKAVGIEIPNLNSSDVLLRDILTSETYSKMKSKSKLTLALGKHISGEPFVADLGRMPHLLIAGSTGSGKSVALNSIITSILYNATPDEVRFIMVDPKRVELSIYNKLPHLIAPVVTESRKAAVALKWTVEEMERRYRVFEDVGVKNLTTYSLHREHQLVEAKASGSENVEDEVLENLPIIIVVVDEIGDLMSTAKGEAEEMIIRLAQKARATGIHLILATQRPSVNVITGVIKANFPARIAFQVSSMQDSRVILDMNGAEKLLGRGDMLFKDSGAPKPVRLQGSFVSEEEVENVVGFISDQMLEIFEKYGEGEDILDKTDDEYDEEIKEMKQVAAAPEPNGAPADVIQNGQNAALFDEKPEFFGEEFDDELVEQAIALIKATRQASVSGLQRRMKIGFNRAGRLMDILEKRGIVGPPKGSKPRDILIPVDDEEESEYI